jgi:hypothetical protein
MPPPIARYYRDDERPGLDDEGGHVGKPLLAQGDRRLLVHRRVLAGPVLRGAAPRGRCDHPSDHERLGMRVLPAREDEEPAEGALPGERLEVMGDDHEVELGRQPVGRVAPVAVGEGPRPAGRDEPRDPVTDLPEVRWARKRPVAHRARERRGCRRVRPERVDHVDPVERMQVVEVDYVVGDVLRPGDEVAEQAGVAGDPDAESVLDRPHGREGVDGR